MRFPGTRLAAALFAFAALPDDASAHALAQRYDLPLPLGFFLAAAGAAVAVSFVILAVFWRHDSAGQRPDRTIAHGRIPVGIVAGSQIVTIGALALIVTAGLFGNQNTFKNIAPVAVWVIWWVGLSLICAFVGNIWMLINPWSAIFGFAQWMARPWVSRLSLQLPYPQRLGSWPACALFLLFAWLELVAPARDVPRNVAIATAAYSIFTLLGFAVFGRDAWLKGGEVFSVLFGLFGRFAPLHFIQNNGWYWQLRCFAVGLLTREPLAPSLIAFTLLMLGTVTVDGVIETPLWAAVVEWLLASRGGVDANPRTYMLLLSALLIAGPLLLAALYLAVVAVMARIGQVHVGALAGMFVLSLVPIAIGYHLAHYFSLLAIAGQFIIPLASDPLGQGWDLFGTTLYRIDIGVVDARFIWYLAVTAIVTGHIVAVWIGHVTAYTIFRDAGAARRSQYPMLVLMVGYTMLSLWILAQPIVESAAK
jgi:hypothetical protein